MIHVRLSSWPGAEGNWKVGGMDERGFKIKFSH